MYKLPTIVIQFNNEIEFRAIPYLRRASRLFHRHGSSALGKF